MPWWGLVGGWNIFYVYTKTKHHIMHVRARTKHALQQGVDKHELSQLPGTRNYTASARLRKWHSAKPQHLQFSGSEQYPGFQASRQPATRWATSSQKYWLACKTLPVAKHTHLPPLQQALLSTTEVLSPLLTLQTSPWELVFSEGHFRSGSPGLLPTRKLAWLLFWM